MDANVKRAATEWLRKQHAAVKGAMEVPMPAGHTETQREKDARQFREAEWRREMALIDAIYNEIAGVPS
jgi:hypothetical protein